VIDESMMRKQFNVMYAEKVELKITLNDLEKWVFPFENSL